MNDELLIKTESILNENSANLSELAGCSMCTDLLVCEDDVEYAQENRIRCARFNVYNKLVGNKGDEIYE